jgi:hypothetical protein
MGPNYVGSRRIHLLLLNYLLALRRGLHFLGFFYFVQCIKEKYTTAHAQPCLTDKKKTDDINELE